MSPTPAPRALRLRRGSRQLEVEWPDGRVDALSFEYLRVFSPSAEVQGHGGGEPVLVPGKRAVDLLAVEPVGGYAVRLRFSDGHASGLYTWTWLRDLATGQAAHWARYEQRLAAAGMSRDSARVTLAGLPPARS
ncbi:MAG TPA: DUF971 domain-containing protein [Nevskiaceae bacterium]|nr:DUF971 domain-containing protein [Nevskiaceae bacterium]